MKAEHGSLSVGRYKFDCGTAMNQPPLTVVEFESATNWRFSHEYRS